mgnify:CR=1 FL=1
MWVAGLKVRAGAGRTEVRDRVGVRVSAAYCKATEVRDRVGVRVSAAYCKATERIVSGQYSMTRCK